MNSFEVLFPFRTIEDSFYIQYVLYILTEICSLIWSRELLLEATALLGQKFSYLTCKKRKENFTKRRLIDVNSTLTKVKKYASSY